MAKELTSPLCNHSHNLSLLFLLGYLETKLPRSKWIVAGEVGMDLALSQEFHNTSRLAGSSWVHLPLFITPASWLFLDLPHPSFC